MIRGQVVISGPAGSPSGKLGGLEVLLLLAVPQHPLLLGRTVTLSDGSFSCEVEVPKAAPLGHFGVIARVRGDASRRGSSSARYDRLGPGQLQREGGGGAADSGHDFVGNN
jgi:hypothetical protein